MAGVGLSGREIVCVGFNDWNTELWTNQHHLMARLATRNRVLFVESLGLRRPTAAARDLRRIVKRLSRGLRGARPQPDPWAGSRARPAGPADLHVLSPLVLPLHSRASVRALNGIALRRMVGRAARRLGMRRPILWAYVPQAESLLDELDPALVIYHCVDDIAAQDRVDSASFRAAERRIVERADLVLTSAPALASRLAELSDHVLYLPNVADTELFSGALGPGPVDPALERLPSPRIVFTGAIAASKLDLGLIGELARLRPQWSFALVGPVGLGDPLTDISAVDANPNVHLLGARPYAALPEVLRGANAALIPYARNELTASIFPMKVYEYLAAGLPVVATSLPALEQVQDIVVADDAATTARTLDELLASDTPERRAERSRHAAGHSWSARLREISAAIDAAEIRREDCHA